MIRFRLAGGDAGLCRRGVGHPYPSDGVKQRMATVSWWRRREATGRGEGPPRSGSWCHGCGDRRAAVYVDYLACVGPEDVTDDENSVDGVREHPGLVGTGSARPSWAEMKATENSGGQSNRGRVLHPVLAVFGVESQCRSCCDWQPWCLTRLLGRATSPSLKTARCCGPRAATCAARCPSRCHALTRYGLL